MSTDDLVAEIKKNAIEEVRKAVTQNLAEQLESTGLSAQEAATLAKNVAGGDPTAVQSAELIGNAISNLQNAGVDAAGIAKVVKEINRRKLTDPTVGGAADDLVGRAVLVELVGEDRVSKLPPNANPGDLARSLLNAQAAIQLVGADPNSPESKALIDGILGGNLGRDRANALIKGFTDKPVGVAEGLGPDGRPSGAPGGQASGTPAPPSGKTPTSGGGGGSTAQSGQPRTGEGKPEYGGNGLPGIPLAGRVPPKSESADDSSSGTSGKSGNPPSGTPWNFDDYEPAPEPSTSDSLQPGPPREDQRDEEQAPDYKPQPTPAPPADPEPDDTDDSDSPPRTASDPNVEYNPAPSEDGKGKGAKKFIDLSRFFVPTSKTGTGPDGGTQTNPTRDGTVEFDRSMVLPDRKQSLLGNPGSPEGVRPKPVVKPGDVPPPKSTSGNIDPAPEATPF
jgi:hypothetical protein